MRLWRNPRDGYFHIRQGQIRKALGTKDPDLAEKLYNQYIGLDEEERVEQLEGRSRLILSKFRDRYLSARARLSKSTLRADRYALNKLIASAGDRPVSSITKEDIEKLLSEVMDAGRKRNTANSIGRHLRAAFNEAIEWELATKNPLRKIRLKRVSLPPPPLVVNDRRQGLLDACDRLAKEHVYPAADPRSKLPSRWTDFRRFLEVLLALGLRRIELVRLKWKDVREETIVIWGKGDKYREVPATKAVLELLGVRGEAEEYVFPRWRDPNVITRMMKAVTKEARIQGVTPHTLRHTTETQLAMKGVDIQGRMALLGHSSMEMAIRYTHVTEEQLRGALLQIEGEVGQQGKRRRAASRKGSPAS
jgi:integrase